MPPQMSRSAKRQMAHVLPTRWPDDDWVRLCALAEDCGCGNAEILRRLVRSAHPNIIQTRALTSALLEIGHALRDLAAISNDGEGMEVERLNNIYRRMLESLARLK